VKHTAMSICKVKIDVGGVTRLEHTFDTENDAPDKTKLTSSTKGSPVNCSPMKKRKYAEPPVSLDAKVTNADGSESEEDEEGFDLISKFCDIRANADLHFFKTLPLMHLRSVIDSISAPGTNNTKRFNNYTRKTSRGHAFIERLGLRLGLQTENLHTQQHGGSLPGVYAHPLIIIHFAQSINADLAVTCQMVIFNELVACQVTTQRKAWELKMRDEVAQVIQRMKNKIRERNVSRIPTFTSSSGGMLIDTPESDEDFVTNALAGISLGGPQVSQDHHLQFPIMSRHSQ